MSNKRGKREIGEILGPYLLTVIIAASAMVFLILVWLLVGDNYSRNTNGNNVSAQTEQTGAVQQTTGQTAAGSQEQQPQTQTQPTEALGQTITEPEIADGSGRAGVMTLSEDMSSVSSKAGLYSNNIGTWYAPEDGYCYYNGWATLDGNRYHFDSAGYMDTGWTAIGGQGCYFGDSGIYDPDKDGSMLIALTFDDGPSKYTSEILDILEQNNAQATFMMVGTQVEKFGDIVPRMLQLGNTIGNHSYDHADMLSLSTDGVVNEFASVDTLLEQYGTTSKVVRFPYGSYTKELASATGKPHIYWDVDSRDWESRNTSAILEVINSEVEPGAIILMHDIYAETLEAVRTLVPSLIEQGYELVNIEELAASKGYALNSGVTYFSFSQNSIERGKVTDE